MNAVHMRPGQPSTLWLWMHDCPEKCVRFPVFTHYDPEFIVRDAARHYARTANRDYKSGLISLRKRHA